MGTDGRQREKLRQESERERFIIDHCSLYPIFQDTNNTRQLASNINHYET